jgi:hypothetical protein
LGHRRSPRETGRLQRFASVAKNRHPNRGRPIEAPQVRLLSIYGNTTRATLATDADQRHDVSRPLSAKRSGEYTVLFASWPVTKIDTIECDKIDIDDLLGRTRQSIEHYLASLPGAD